MTDMNESFFIEPEDEEKPKNELPDIEAPENEIPVYAHDSEKQKRGAGRRPPIPDAAARRRRSPFMCFCAPLIISCAVLCCILPAGVIGGIGALAAVSESNRITERSTENLPVVNDGNVKLEVTNLVGSTRILGANVNDIQVDIEKSASGLDKDHARERVNDLEVNVRRDGDRYIIEVTDNGDNKSFNVFGNAKVELRITVPRELNITASNDVGELSVRDVEIIDELKLTNDVGGIEFDGKIDGEGSYDIVNQVGGIEVRLDRDSRVRIDARADVGGIDLSVDLQKSSESRETVSHSITGIYGDNDTPDATLTIRNDVGGISITD